MDFDDIFDDEDFNEDFNKDFNDGDLNFSDHEAAELPGTEKNLRGGMDFFVRRNSVCYPAALQPGDKIALISPASAVKEEYVLGAMTRIMERGYQPVLMKYALGHESGSFSATKGDRLMDFFDAIGDPETKAILCTRGGYGSCQLLPHFSYGMKASNPKWIIGFSDVSAILASWYRGDIASIHGPMAKHLATMPADDPCTDALFSILESGGKFNYNFPGHPYNVTGETTGVLLGGNLATLTDLADTPDDILSLPRPNEKVIFFLEDINEPIYKVNRMLWRFVLNGTLHRLRGLILGQFTDYKPDANYDTMEDMIHEFLHRNLLIMGFPVAYNFPTGHTDANYPLVEGAKVRFKVTKENVELETI